MIKNKRVQSVLASMPENACIIALPDNLEAAGVIVSKHTCNECNSGVIVNSMNAPSCPVCASAMEAVELENTENEHKITKDDAKELTSAGHCDVCDTKFVSTAAFVAAAEGSKAACPICASSFTVTAGDDEDEENEDELPSRDELDGEDIEGEDATIEDVTDEEADGELDAIIESSEGDASVEESEETFDDSDLEMPEGEEGGEETESDDESEETSDEEENEDDSDDEEDEEALAAYLAAAEEETETSEDAEEETETPAEEPEEDEEEELPSVKDSALPVESSVKAKRKIVKPAPKAAKVEAAAKVKANAFAYAIASNAEFELVPSTKENGKTRYYLMADAQPVAVADEERADEGVQEIFENRETFAQAFYTAISNTDNAEETVKSFGFDPVTVEVPVDVATKEAMEKEIEEKTRQATESIEQASNKFAVCLSAAALGIRKGSFGVASPLRNALIDAFKNNGVRGASRIVDSVMEQASADDLKLLISKAVELASMPVAAFNAQASIIETSSYAIAEAEEINEAPQHIQLAGDILPFKTKEEVASARNTRTEDSITARAVLASLIPSIR